MDSETIAAEQLQEKWNPILEHGDMPKIEDSYRKRVTAFLKTKRRQSWKQPTLSAGGMSPVVGGEGNIKGYDPILISLVRRASLT